MWGVLKKIKIMIRDWREINENNVNDPVPGYLHKIGRAWITSAFRAKDNERGMYHIMSLNPDMSSNKKYSKISDFPPSLLIELKYLKIYIECGGPFKNFFCFKNLFSIYSMTLNDQPSSVRFLFEQGAHPPDFDNTKVPLWIRKVYQEVQRKRQNCKVAYAALHLLRLSPWGRPQRDILGMVLRQVWDTRINNEWEL